MRALRQNLTMKSVVSARPSTGGTPSPAAVREHLEELRQALPFRSSPRSLRFLQYVVEETLAGRSDNLKERTIGVAAFNRPADYDSEADPVVRQAAVEVRKRLLQYYSGPGAHLALRIEIPAGSYVATFRGIVSEPQPEPAAPKRRLTGRKWWVSGVVLATVVFLGFRLFRTSTPLESFWEPVLKGSPQILLCIGKGAGFRAASRVAAEQSEVQRDERSLNVHTADALVLARLSGFFAKQGQQLLVRSVGELTFAELRENPAVLIGAFNNDWSLKLTGELRYQFRLSPTGRDEWVEDTTQPGSRKWGLSNIPNNGDVAEDYAIVTRVLNPNTGRMLVVLGGLTYHATLAAGEFVTNPEAMRGLAATAPRNWSRKNLQVVLATRVTNNYNGPPRIIATHIW